MVLEDLPTDEHLRLFASADVCVAPSRWEGLGLHLYESMALGLPVITNDAPPMNEVIRDGDNGLLIASRRRGRASSGIPAYAPSVRGLAAAIAETLEPGRLAELRAGVARRASGSRGRARSRDYGELIESASGECRAAAEREPTVELPLERTFDDLWRRAQPRGDHAALARFPDRRRRRRSRCAPGR